LSEANASFCQGGTRFRNMMMLNAASPSDCQSSPSRNDWMRYIMSANITNYGSFHDYKICEAVKHP